MKQFISDIKALQNYLNNDVQDDIGIQAVQHFKKSFHDEAFSDVNEKDMKWQEVKRRQGGGKGAAATRKILTGETGELGESINYKKQGRDVLITTPKVYAKVHNEGGKSGRGKGFMMIKRQFIGPSELLNKKIKKKISQRINAIMKR